VAALLILWDRVLADAALDSERHHRFARTDLGIRSSVIPINPRGHEGAPGGQYRFRDWFPPLWELKLPVAHGEPWTVAIVMKPKGEQVTFEQLCTFTAYGPEQVFVPAGTFIAIRVVKEDQLLWSGETTWYAPGVGVVKSEFSVGPRVQPRREEMVLTYFALGTP